VDADADAGAVLAVMVAAGGGHGPPDDVVDGAEGERVVGEVAQPFDDAAARATADEDQAEDKLVPPVLGDGQGKEDAVVGDGVLGAVVKGLTEGVWGLVGLPVDELTAGLVLGGEPAERSGAGAGLEGEVLALAGGEVFGGAGRSRRRGGWGGARGYNAQA
jgi:hypothetical protein